MNGQDAVTPGEKRPEVAETPLRLTSDALFRNQRELVIVHHGREYRLRLTQNDKLILTA